MHLCLCRSLIAWSCRVSLAERSHSSFALTVVCMFLSLSLPLSSGDAVDGRQWIVQALSAKFCDGAHRRCRVAEEDFHL
jgi:hypothetical protein